MRGGLLPRRFTLTRPGELRYPGRSQVAALAGRFAFCCAISLPDRSGRSKGSRLAPSVAFRKPGSYPALRSIEPGLSSGREARRLPAGGGAARPRQSIANPKDCRYFAARSRDPCSAIGEKKTEAARRPSAPTAPASSQPRNPAFTRPTRPSRSPSPRRRSRPPRLPPRLPRSSPRGRTGIRTRCRRRAARSAPRLPGSTGPASSRGRR
jgi:hypothetical protein